MVRGITGSWVLVTALVWLAPGRAAAGGYSDKAILATVQALAKKKEMPKDKVNQLVGNLKASFKDAWFKKARKAKAVDGVLVFRAGEGGFLVKFMKGDGLVSFKGGRQAGPVLLKSWSAGAQVGGSAMWGVALVMGLGQPADFGGDYTGNQSGATGGDASAANAVVLSLSEDEEGKQPHDLYILYAARGLSAGVAGAKMTVTPDW